jgi:hypothetical protein
MEKMLPAAVRLVFLRSGAFVISRHLRIPEDLEHPVDRAAQLIGGAPPHMRPPLAKRLGIVGVGAIGPWSTNIVTARDECVPWTIVH